MYQLKGKNRMGDLDSIIIDGKNISEAIAYANKYFAEVQSIKIFMLDGSNEIDYEELRN